MSVIKSTIYRVYNMSEKIIDLGNGFYNIRGNFHVGGVLNIGTQCSLIQLDNKRFIFLDSYSLTGEIKDKVMAMTDNGKQVEAILNVHPFHTVYCEQMANDFPNATLYGSARHQQKLPHLNWATDTVESQAVANGYPELKFSMSKGIYYIHPNENIHVGSLLVYHPASQALHVDDTFNTLPHFDTIESVLEKIGYSPKKLFLNPLTKLALKPETNAGKAFCDWAKQLADDWQSTRYLCAAHADEVEFEKGEFKQLLVEAVAKMRPKLESPDH